MLIDASTKLWFSPYLPAATYILPYANALPYGAWACSTTYLRTYLRPLRPEAEIVGNPWGQIKGSVVGLSRACPDGPDDTGHRDVTSCEARDFVRFRKWRWWFSCIKRLFFQPGSGWVFVSFLDIGKCSFIFNHELCWKYCSEKLRLLALIGKAEIVPARKITSH